MIQSYYYKHIRHGRGPGLGQRLSRPRLSRTTAARAQPGSAIRLNRDVVSGGLELLYSCPVHGTVTCRYGSRPRAWAIGSPTQNRRTRTWQAGTVQVTGWTVTHSGSGSG